MVGFGSSLRIAKRSGWERAYLDYETLKLLLSQIEAVYEEEGHRRTHGSTGDGFMGDDGSPRTGGGTNRRRKRHNDGDYRDELFLESDSDLAFASSASDIFGNEMSSDEELDEQTEQAGVPKQVLGPAGQTKPFTLTYSQEDISSSEGYDDDEVGGECGSFSRAWRRGDKNAVVGKPPKPKKKSKRREDATDFFVGDFLMGEGNDGQDENADSQGGQPYSSSLLNTSFQRGSYSTEQTSLLPQSQSSTSQTASFYSFPTTRTDSSITPPRDFSGGSAGVSWLTQRPQVETFPKATKPRQPRTAVEIRRSKREEERQRKRRQWRRRRIAKRKREMEQRVPRHLRVAHGKARAITERFLGLLRAEVEKVTLFAQSRLGELADTAGSLRFPSYDDSEYGGSFSESFPSRGPARTRDPYEVLSDGMHPSASSSEDDHMGGRRGPFPWSDTSEEEENSERGKNPLSPSHARKIRKSYSAGGISVSTEHRTNTSSDARKKRKEGKTDNDNSRSVERGKQLADTKQKIKALDAAQRQIAHFEELRQNRPVFQRNDQIVGEDLFLLSAVDEADGYTALGVELTHVLRFICVNVIAVRKICRKHDRLLANRMLGGYYHRHQRGSNEKGRKKQGNRTRDPRKDKSQNPATLGGILSTSVGDDDETESSSPRRRERNKLVGVYDAKIQDLANSTTVQVISKCLALALSEYEVSRSRANALARLNSSSNMAKTPVRRGSRNEETSGKGSALGFGISPARWVPSAYGYEPSKKAEESLEDAASSMASYDEEAGGPPSTASGVSLTRLRFTVVSIFGLREAARPKENMFSSFLSRTSLIFPGPIGEGLDGCSRETLDFFVTYNPDVALLLDPSCLYKGLRDGRWRHCPIENVMLSALATASTAPATPSSSEYPSLLHETDLVMNALSISPDSRVEGGTGPVAKPAVIQVTPSQESHGENACRTLSLNCISLFLYTMNYYIILPSANPFVVSTGAHAPYSSTLVGAASFSAIIGNMLQSVLLSKEAKGSKANSLSISFFRLPLILSAMAPIIGNVLYAIATYRNSIPMAVGGRLLVGLGSSEILHRLLVLAHDLPDVRIVAESARLVKAHVRGVIFSLLLGSLLGAFDVNMFLGRRHIYVPSFAASSCVMAILWFVHWIRLCFYFREPKMSPRVPESEHQSEGERERQGDVFSDSNSESDSSIDNLAQTPESIFFHSSSEGTRDELEAAYGTKPVINAPPQNNTAGNKEMKLGPIAEALAKQRRKRRLATFAGRLFHVLTYNVALPITFALVLLVRFAHEVFFTSCALITSRYFGWSGSLAGVFLGGLSALVLPINYVCEHLSRNLEERTIVKRSLAICSFGLVIMLNWGSLFYIFSRARNILTEEPRSTEDPPYDWLLGRYQYVIGFVVTFVGIIALEATTLSLMSKVAPLKLRGSLINCGSIVTYLSLVGKVAGDIQILMVGLSHRLINTDIVNSLVIPLLVACLVGGYLVKKHFFFLI